MEARSYYQVLYEIEKELVSLLFKKIEKIEYVLAAREDTVSELRHLRDQDKKDFKAVIKRAADILEFGPEGNSKGAAWQVLDEALREEEG